MISLIIPTFNEIDNIATLIKNLDSTLSNKKIEYELIIVDDNSPDKTWAAAEKLSSDFNLKVIRRMKEKGLATAVVTGFMHAKGDIIGVMDADQSHPTEAVPLLIDKISSGSADLAIGSRYVPGGTVEAWPEVRGAISKIGMFLARPLTKVKDTMSGFFFMKKEVIEGVKLNPKGYKILLEILVKGKYKSFTEVPYKFLNRSFGKSKIGARVYIEYVRHILNLYWYKLKKG